MTMAAQEPVVSGHRYTVSLVDGRRPMGLADCVGERLLTLVGNGLSHRVAGTGMEHTGRVRFHQKDLGPDGKDVRVWTISDSGGGSPLLAEHCTAAEPSSELPGSASSVRESSPRPGFPAGTGAGLVVAVPPGQPPVERGDRRWQATATDQYHVVRPADHPMGRSI
jgi:hypothetical protein